MEAEKNKKTSKWERKSAERPAQLVSAAVRLFAERGFAATRLEDVAATAGVSKATVYLYFQNKEHLFEAVVREVVLPNLAKAESILQNFNGTTFELISFFFSIVGSALETSHTAVLKIVIAESGNFPNIARLWSELALQPALKLVTQIIERGLDRKEIRPVNPNEQAPLIMAPIFLLALWKESLGKHVELPMIDKNQILKSHLDNIFRALAPNEGEHAQAGGQGS